MRILITRPLEDAPALATRLRDLGHDSVLAPLLRFEMLDTVPPDFSGVQAILASSANGIRALAHRSPRRDLPVFAVGPQTTQEAQNAGFADVRNADGDARSLAQCAARWAQPQSGALLHVCGDEAPGTLGDALRGHGFTVRRVALYRMAPATQLPADVRKDFSTLDAVVFFSPRTARIFADVTQNLPLSHLVGLCISPATAVVAESLNLAEIRVATRPNQDAMLALVV